MLRKKSTQQQRPAESRGLTQVGSTIIHANAQDTLAGGGVGGGGGGEADFPAVKLAGKILRSVSERKILEPKRGMGKLERESQYGNFASPQLQEIRAINQMR